MAEPQPYTLGNRTFLVRVPLIFAAAVDAYNDLLST